MTKNDRESAAHAQFMIGTIQRDAGNPKAALKSFFKVLYGYSAPTWQSKAAYEAARTLETLGDSEQAAKTYQELIDKFPTSEQAAPAKKRLAEMKANH